LSQKRDARFFEPESLSQIVTLKWRRLSSQQPFHSSPDGELRERISALASVVKVRPTDGGKT